MGWGPEEGGTDEKDIGLNNSNGAALRNRGEASGGAGQQLGASRVQFEMLTRHEGNRQMESHVEFRGGAKLG